MNPDILLVEDDPTTRAYLESLVATLPARAESAGTLAEALARCEGARYALWLIDAHLPDGHGLDLLATLRARHPATPALAHTATPDRGEIDALLEGGFDAVLAKPVDGATWLMALRRALQHDAAHTAPIQPSDATSEPASLWDDEAAARALGGNPANVASLRRLFLGELPAQLAAIREGGEATRHDQLHRLAASCALVGAARLGRAAQMLQAEPGDEDALNVFVQTAQQTLDQAPSSAG